MGTSLSFTETLKCNTLIKLWLGMENWETCVFFLFLLLPLLLPSKWKGSGIWQHICNKKVHFTSKKLPHTLIQCEPRQRVNHKAVFGEKQEVLDQFHLRKVPSGYSTCFFFKLFVILFRDTVNNCILDFTPRQGHPTRT